jgi:hypothetical protein
MYLLPRRWAVFDFDCHHGVVDADAMVMVLEAASVASCGCGGCELAMSRDSGRTLGRYYWVWYAHTTLIPRTLTPCSHPAQGYVCRSVATFDVKKYFNHSRNFSTRSLVPAGWWMLALNTVYYDLL